MSVLWVAPSQTQSTLLEAEAEDKGTTEFSLACHGLSADIENVLKQLFLGRITVSDANKDLMRKFIIEGWRSPADISR